MTGNNLGLRRAIRLHGHGYGIKGTASFGIEDVLRPRWLTFCTTVETSSIRRPRTVDGKRRWCQYDYL